MDGRVCVFVSLHKECSAESTAARRSAALCDALQLHLLPLWLFFYYWGGKGREKVTEGKAVTSFNYSSITSSSVVNTQQSRKLCILKCSVFCPDLTTQRP